MKTETLFKGCLVMKEDQNGFWYFMHYPDRQPLTEAELNILKKNSDNRWILIKYPTQQKQNENG